MEFHKNQIFYSMPVIIFGASSVVMQILMMQELISQFYGNELCIGTTLACWLIWTAAGSGIVPRMVPIKQHPALQLAALQFIWAAIMVATPVLVRIAKPILKISASELPGLFPIIGITAVVLGPFCLFSGFFYTMSCHWKDKGNSRFSPPDVFILESIGAGAGGLLISFFLIRSLETIPVVLILAGFNIISAGAILIITMPSRWLRFTLPILTVYAVLWLFSPRIENILNRMTYPYQTDIISKMTPYGKISITRLKNQHNLYQNGLWIRTYPDPLSAETAVHTALIQHASPQRILLISGGAELLQEILKHPSVQHVDYLEINPAVTQWVRRKIPEAGAILDNPKIHIHHHDARHFISQSRDSYDVIISNLPNPYTNQLNRFYTRHFFSLVKNRLADPGIFAFHIQAEENVISRELSDFLSMLASTVFQVFPDLTIIPGETQQWLISKQAGTTFSDPEKILERLRKRRISTQYIREYYIRYNLSQDRIRHVWDDIHSSDKRNTDFRPMGYYYDTILWATHFSLFFKTLFLTLSRYELKHWLIWLFVIFFLIFLLQRIKPKGPWPRIFLKSSIWAVGFTEISMEIILILGFQILWGATYKILAMLIAAYMLGLSLGSAIARKNYQTRTARYRTFIYLQGAIGLYTLLCIPGMILCRQIAMGPLQILIPGFFIVLTLSAGGFGGYQFVLANHLYIRSGENLVKKAGALYSTDLAGSALGAFLVSVFFIPILGIINCLLLLSVLNGLMFFLMVFSRNRD